MNIFNYDLITLQQYAKEHTVLSKDNPPEIDKELAKIRANPSFLPHSIALLANIKPQRNNLVYSASKTVEAIPSLVTIEGQSVTKEEILALLGLLYYYSFSSYCKFSQSKYEYNSAIPFMLYAQKIYNNIAYDRWDRTDPLLKAFMNKDLKEVIGLRFPELSEEAWEQARVLSVTDGKGERQDFSSYKCNATLVPEITSLPNRLMKHMYLKTWIFANPTAKMIVDVNKWDYIPEEAFVVTTKPRKDLLPW